MLAAAAALALVILAGGCGKGHEPMMTSSDVALNFIKAVFAGETKEGFSYFFIPKNATEERRRMETRAFMQGIEALHRQLSEDGRAIDMLEALDVHEDLKDEKATLKVRITYTNGLTSVTSFMLRIGDDGEWKIARAK